MNFQLAGVLILFAIALFYVGRMLYRSFKTDKGCGGNCKCGIDFSEVSPKK